MDDDGSKIEYISNDSKDITLNWHNERWKITKPDSTKYHFGRYRQTSSRDRIARSPAGSIGKDDSGDHTALRPPTTIPFT